MSPILRPKLVDPPSKHLLCIACDDILVDPVMCSGGHNFCRVCVTNSESFKTIGHSCHICGAVLFHDSLVPNLAISGVIQGLSSFCIFENCNWIGIYSDFESHVQCYHQGFSDTAKLQNSNTDDECSESSPLEENLNFCRICLANQDDDAESELVSPCLCAGTMKYIHKSCFQKLRDMSPEHAAKCKSCQFVYRKKRNLRSSIAVFVNKPWLPELITMMLVVTIITIAGFVPLPEEEQRVFYVLNSDMWFNSCNKHIHLPRIMRRIHSADSVEEVAAMIYLYAKQVVLGKYQYFMCTNLVITYAGVMISGIVWCCRIGVALLRAIPLVSIVYLTLRYSHFREHLQGSVVEYLLGFWSFVHFTHSTVHYLLELIKYLVNRPSKGESDVVLNI